MCSQSLTVVKVKHFRNSHLIVHFLKKPFNGHIPQVCLIGQTTHVSPDLPNLQCSSPLRHTLVDTVVALRPR